MASRDAIADRILICFACIFSGASIGLIGGFLIALLNTPARNPAQPTANEWYVIAILASGFGGAIGGGVIGLFDGLLRRPGFGILSLSLGLVGALVGYFIS